MFSSDYIRVCYKNLSRRKARTYLTIFAVSIGATLILIIFSLAFGVEDIIVKELQRTGKLTQIIVRPAIEGAQGGPPGTEAGVTEVKEGLKRAHEIPQNVADKIGEIGHVEDVAPMVSIAPKSIQLSGQDKFYAANIQAVTIAKGTKLELLAGRNFTPSDKEKVIIGQAYLKTFGYKESEADKLIGQDLKIKIPKESIPGEEVEKEIRRRYGERFQEQFSRSEIEKLFQQTHEELSGKETQDFTAEIIGISSSSFESTNIYIPIAWVPDIAEYRWNNRNWIEDYGYHSILVTVDGVAFIDEVTEKIKKLDVSTQSFKSMFESMLQLFSTIEIVLGLFGLTALFVATIGIINTMVMTTYERVREIGVMRATGASKKVVSRLFTREAGLIGFLGGFSGVIIGILGAQLIKFVVNTYVLPKADVTSNPVLAGGAKNLFLIPLWLPLVIIAFTTFLGLIAGLFPARRAANLDPVDALKYE